MRRGGNADRRGNPYADMYDGDDDGGDDDLPLSLRVLGPLGPILLSEDYSNPEELQNRLRIYAVTLIGVSAFFWLWALYNTFHLRNSSGGFDLGETRCALAFTCC